jgi:hypothetical protein
MKVDWAQTSHDLGKVIVVIYDGNDVLINCRSFIRYNPTSPFHGIPNRRIINTFKDRLKEITTSYNNK